MRNPVRTDPGGYDPEDIAALAEKMGLTVEEVKAACHGPHEFNLIMVTEDPVLQESILKS